jgi:RNA polymerase sigma factor (sigma-70 family)
MAENKPSKKEELILIRKVQRGDEDALRILLDLHRVSLLVHANKYLRNTSDRDAEDAVQEASVRIWKSIKTFDHTKASFSTWAHKITENVCIDMLTSWQGEEGERTAYARKWDMALKEIHYGGDDDGDWGTEHNDTWDHGCEEDPVLKAKNETILQRIRKREIQWGEIPQVISSAERATLGKNVRPPKLTPREERILKEERMGTPRKEIAEKEKITPKALKTVISRINKKFSRSVTS